METDIKVEVPSTKDEQTEEISIKAFIEETEQEWLERSSSFLCRAEFNERMIAGDQNISIMNDSIEVDDDFENDGSTRNYLTNLSLTWSSRILEERPSIKAYPNEPGVDIKKADAANKLLEYCKQNQDFDDLCFKAAELVQPHTAVAFKIVWDPLYGPRSKGVQVYDDFGNPIMDSLGRPKLSGVGKPLGDVRWTVNSIFDYYTDGSEEVEDSEYVCFIDMISMQQAKKLANIYDNDIKLSEETSTNIWGVKKTGVKIREMWVRPDNYQFPDGLFTVMIGDTVLFAVPFPYDHGEIPIGVWKCGRKRASEYGTSHINNSISIQKTINQNVSAIDEQARLIRGIKLLAHTSITDALSNGNQRIPVDDPNISNAARYLEPPDRAKVLVTSLSDNERALFAVFGLNELLTGADSMKSGTAAKSIAYLNKLDSMKMAGASRSLNKTILRVMKQTLKLYQQFLKSPYLSEILGKGTLTEADLFIGADLAGVDVRLEPISGFSQYRATVAEGADTAMQQTGATPELMSQSQTGLKQTSYDKSQRDIVSSQIQFAIQGQEQQADQTLDPMIAMDEILGVITDYIGTPQYQNLISLLNGYKTMMQQKQQEQQAAPQQGSPQ